MKAENTERTARRGVAMAMGVFESLGFAFREQSESDYGIDGHAELIVSDQPTGQLLGIQIKTGSSYLSERTEKEVIFRTDPSHVEYWLKHSLPVIICLCDLDQSMIYWQPVNEDTAISTGKGYKFKLPLNDTLGLNSISLLTDLLTPIIPPNQYTIFKTEDVSHGLAKRYSFKIVTNGAVSKAEIASIIRQVTIDGAKRRYCRSHLVKGHWGDADAHVVWVFVYPSAEDESQNNYICRSLWINETLEESSAPLALEGENIGDGVIVDWNEHYTALADYILENSLNKEDYLNLVIPRIEELKLLTTKVDNGLMLLNSDLIKENTFLSSYRIDLARIREIYRSLFDMKAAPFECKSMDESLKAFVSSMDNISLHYSDKGLELWPVESRLYLSLGQLSSARDRLEDLNYELKRTI